MNQTDYNIADRLPESLNRENLRQVAQVIDEKMHELDMMSEFVSIYPRIDELSSNLIDALAIQMHVDFYDTTLPLEKRRALVKNSVRWHMRKGTKGVVQELVQTVFDSGVVYEWFEYGGEPYYFKVELLTAPQMTIENINLLAKVINTVKNVRSWLESLGFKRQTVTSIFYGGLPYLHKTYTIKPAEIQDAETSAATVFGGLPSTHNRYEVFPREARNSTTTVNQYVGVVNTLYKQFSIEEE